MAGKRAGKSSWPEYRICIAFKVPLKFAFSWCTDYTPEDAQLEGEVYQRKIIERTAKRVVFEDLEEMKDGWFWGRDTVTLHPPNRWHMDGVGNRREVTADYLLTALPDGRTQLELRWKRHPTVREAKPLTKAQREASTLIAWKRFGRAMEKDYRHTRSPSTQKTM